MVQSGAISQPGQSIRAYGTDRTTDLGADQRKAHGFLRWAWHDWHPMRYDAVLA